MNIVQPDKYKYIKIGLVVFFCLIGLCSWLSLMIHHFFWWLILTVVLIAILGIRSLISSKGEKWRGVDSVILDPLGNLLQWVQAIFETIGYTRTERSDSIRIGIVVEKDGKKFRVRAKPRVEGEQPSIEVVDESGNSLTLPLEPDDDSYGMVVEFERQCTDNEKDK